MAEIMQFSMFVVLFVRCSDSGLNHHVPGMCGIEGSSRVYRPIPIRPANTYETDNNRLYNDRSNFIDVTNRANPNHNYSMDQHAHSHDIHEMRIEESDHSTVWRPWSIPPANNDQQVLRPPPALQMPPPLSGASTQMPVSNTSAFHPGQVDTMSCNSSLIRPATQTHDEVSAVPDVYKSDIGAVGISDTLETVSNAAIYNDSKCRLKDLAELMDNIPECILWLFATDSNIFEERMRLYQSVTITLCDELPLLLLKCVKWKRMELNYIYNPEDMTKTKLSRMYVSCIHAQDCRMNSMVRSQQNRIMKCRSLLYRNILNLHTKVTSAVKCYLGDLFTQSTAKRVATSKAAFGGWAARAKKTGGAEEEYDKALVELSGLVASLPNRYVWLVVYVNTACKHATFLASIIDSILNLLNEMEAKYTAVENETRMEIGKVRLQGRCSFKMARCIAGRVYGSSTIVAWAKNSCERLLKLRYKLAIYDPLTANAQDAAQSYEGWDHLESRDDIQATPNQTVAGK